MIINLIFGVILGLISAIFFLLPVVTIASIPVIGSTLLVILGTMVTTWNAFMITFPYAQVVWQVFLFVILPFEILMIIGKFFLGQHMPTN
jgi:hypothetical protein